MDNIKFILYFSIVHKNFMQEEIHWLNHFSAYARYILSLVSFGKFIAVWYLEMTIEMSLAVSIIMFAFIPWISRTLSFMPFYLHILTIFLFLFWLQSWDFDFHQFWICCGLTCEYSRCVLFPAVYFVLTWPNTHYAHTIFKPHYKWLIFSVIHTVPNIKLG